MHLFGSGLYIHTEGYLNRREWKLLVLFDYYATAIFIGVI